MKQELEQAVQAAVKELYGGELAASAQSGRNAEVAVELARPEEKFGDYATNVALQLAGQLGRKPRELAEELAGQLRQDLAGKLQEVTVAGPGFINLKVSDDQLSTAVQAATTLAKPLAGKTVVAEYSDPNPFKVLHAGHLYTSIVGDATANLLETAGATVHRVNFGGDVGLHVGKTLYVILQKLGAEHPDKLSEIQGDKRSEWMAACYVEGTNAYEEDEQAKAAVIELNQRVYRIHAENDRESPLAQIYWTCRQWSYDYFNDFYGRIGSRFEKYYPESEVADLGLKTVKEQLAKGVFKESEGAVIFPGEDYGLHTRVFINRQAIPTYEAKDVGLIMAKWQDYHFDKSVIITGNEQEQYMAVVLKAIEQFAPELAAATSHLTHGIVKLAGGVKMSSRKGNILRAVDVLDAAAEANRETTGQDNQEAVLGAVKYAFLKQRIGADIIYDPKESVAILGNTGPYLQYAHARARSILAKAAAADGSEASGGPAPDDGAAGAEAGFEPAERSLARKTSEYPEAVAKATAELLPHHVATYLYELAQTFNSFYEHNRVIGDQRQAMRLSLVSSYADVLSSGLKLLGIPAPDKM